MAIRLDIKRTYRLSAACGFAALMTLAPVARAQNAASSAQESFDERVQPIIFKNCSGCHTSGGHASALTMNSLASVLKGGSRGSAITPGNPAASVLSKALHYDWDDLRMPPRGKIADSDIAIIDKWILDNPQAAGCRADCYVRVRLERRGSRCATRSGNPSRRFRGALDTTASRSRGKNGWRNHALAGEVLREQDPPAIRQELLHVPHQPAERRTARRFARGDFEGR